jgi:hypothetical protein
MSWDVMLFKFKGVLPKSAEEIEEANMVPLGPSTQVREAISSTLPGVNWSDPFWGVVDGPGFSIEFNTGKEEPIKSIMLHVRGSGNAVPAIMAFAVPAGWSAFDCSTGEFLDPVKPSDEGWKKFQAYGDQMIRSRSPAGGIIALAFLALGCDNSNTAATAPAPTTMPNPSAPTGMSQFPYLAADGGPHMLLPVDVASSWSGTGSLLGALNPKSDYGRACTATANSQIAGLSVGNGTALVFSNPPMTACGKSSDGLVEVYDLEGWTNTNLDALIQRATSSLPTSSLVDTKLKLRLQQPDAFLLYAGDTPTQTAYGVHRVPLAAGTYHVLSGKYSGPGEAVTVYRLQPGT